MALCEVSANVAWSLYFISPSKQDTTGPPSSLSPAPPFSSSKTWMLSFVRAAGGSAEHNKPQKLPILVDSGVKSFWVQGHVSKKKKKSGLWSWEPLLCVKAPKRMICQYLDMSDVEPEYVKLSVDHFIIFYPICRRLKIYAIFFGVTVFFQWEKTQSLICIPLTWNHSF